MPHALRDLTYYVAGDLPAAPIIRPVPAPGNGNWGMDGNDTYGDCGVAGLHHGDMCVEYDTGTPVVPVTSDQIVDYYMTYTGGQDSGVVLADFLKYVKTTGFFGHSLAAYAPVKISDMATLKFAVNAYSYAYTGIVVTQGMMDATNAGKPWTAANATGTVLGGHCVPIVGYGLDELWIITWGQLQSVAYSAWPIIAEEAWACIWGEVAAKGVHGVSLPALQADLLKLAA
jgi:hypothetical protein